MNEGDESFPSMVTRNKKKRIGFRYSSKKALECSRVTKRTIKVGATKLTSVTKALVFSEKLSSEKGFADFTIFESVEEIEGERIAVNFSDTVKVVEDHQRASII
jgi:hypothetical protein